MERRFLVLTFALGLIGGAALGTGWYTATANESSSYLGGGAGSIAVGVHPTGGGTSQAVPRPGHWALSESGALMWVADDGSESGSRIPDAQWYADRAKAMAGLEREIGLQINGDALVP